MRWFTAFMAPRKIRLTARSQVWSLVLYTPSPANWLEAALPLLATMAIQLAVGGAAVAVGCRDGCANGAPRG
jgi:hypothetical protein